MAEIKYIPVSKLWRHPDNPRKDLGDVTELAESIKVNGVLQNLTVVPLIGEITKKWDGESYRVIIGHRRLAAAKLAGLEELPCVVVEMSEREQLSTMLTENMQRSDLTVYEQAQGFQMMLDMGDTVEDIAEKSGFSATTVRRRVKLLELDKDKFKKSEERGVSLFEYMELDKLKSPERKNEMLDYIGTENFKYKLKQAINDEAAEARKALWVEQLSTFATQITDKTGKIVSVKVVDGSEDLLLVTQAGILIRTAVENIRIAGRATQGVIVMRFKEEGDRVISMALTDREQDAEKEPSHE